MRIRLLKDATHRTMFLIALVSGITASSGFFMSFPSARTDDNTGIAREQLGLVSEIFDGTRTYTHPTHNFSLQYLAELLIDEYDEGDGAETILFYGGAGDRDIGFQIFITPFEGRELTADRILEDVPSIVISEPLRVVVNPSAPEEDRIEGLIFWSEDGAGLRTRELWFAYNGSLYEVTTYEHLDEWLIPIVDTWRFF